MVAYKHISHGFDPVFDARSRVLVLGSFPSEASRLDGFYYGNPRNRFWEVVAACVGEPVPQDIELKKALLLAHGIALWDVIQSCDIKGSSDASIKNVVPAEVELVTEVAHIERVICNGATAGRLYHRFLEWKLGMPAEVLPSTSPANASWSTDRLLGRWQETLGDPIAAPPAPDDVVAASLELKSHERHAPLATNWAVHKSMQGNKGKNTKPELLVRERLQAAGLTGYRLQWKVPGRPDVAWPGKRVCVFVNGCFWHRCPYCKPSMPSKNVEYWEAKFARNVERDAQNLTALREDGWRVHVVWECQLKKTTQDATFAELLPVLAQELGKELKLPPA